MFQYDIAKFMVRDREAEAAESRLARELIAARARRPLRAFIGRRLVRMGLRLAAAQG